MTTGTDFSTCLCCISKKDWVHYAIQLRIILDKWCWEYFKLSRTRIVIIYINFEIDFMSIIWDGTKLEFSGTTIIKDRSNNLIVSFEYSHIISNWQTSWIRSKCHKSLVNLLRHYIRLVRTYQTLVSKRDLVGIWALLKLQIYANCNCILNMRKMIAWKPE